MTSAVGEGAMAIRLIHEYLEVESMPAMGVTRFERFFRTAAGLDVDKDDLKRYGDFVDQKAYGTGSAPSASSTCCCSREAGRPFDVVIHIDETRAVEPLERTAGREKGEAPETYPFTVRRRRSGGRLP